MLAILHDSAEMATLLLENGADPNQTTHRASAVKPLSVAKVFTARLR